MRGHHAYPDMDHQCRDGSHPADRRSCCHSARSTLALVERTKASTSAAGGIYVGTYRTLSACKADGRNSAQQWTCVPRPDGKFDLYVYN
ncbi:hypothetical protein [Streptomyces sp. NRRL S-337]|uniref:hypothetical protein n=1 Tax=Streptomyces sp. NRRL S-337 TaxID=1463900 RepID=UPI00131A9017|nr:hypothetical protein [Streptomyces sp. NRRL S-337]